MFAKWLRGSDDHFLSLVRGSQARKDDAARRIRYYNDQQSEDTLRLIAQRFSEPETFRVLTVNIVKKVTNKRAATYRLAPKRRFDGIDQATGEAIYRAMNADGVLKRASRLTKLLKTTALHVVWDESDNRPALRLVTPNILDADYRDPERPSRIVVTHSASRPEDVTYADWTPERFATRDARGRIIFMPDNPVGVNPYGALPFVPLFDALPDDEFFLPGGDDLIEAQQGINVALANLWRAVELQAHGQAWATGVPANQALHTGPHRAITLPEGGSFGFAAPKAPIAAILSAIEFLMRQTAAANDVGSDVFDLSMKSESGSAKHAERIDLKEARADDVALWRVYEHRLFEVVKRVANTHAPGTIPEAATLSVDFAEQQESSSEAETLANARTKVELGVWNAADALMAINPDAYSDRAQAFAELMRRKEEAHQLLQDRTSTT